MVLVLISEVDSVTPLAPRLVLAAAAVVAPVPPFAIVVTPVTVALIGLVKVMLPEKVAFPGTVPEIVGLFRPG